METTDILIFKSCESHFITTNDSPPGLGVSLTGCLVRFIVCDSYNVSLT